ncbi:MAG: ATP-dependent sacrificial sulfur transferase LarE [Eubacterium sp.]|nr:ATP-dependent sacrificial sulfur transferase LarE [Eubacterium sp.]
MENNKLENLKDYIRTLENVAVAFSGGADSALLLKIAHDVLGENAIAITLSAKIFPQNETKETKSFCEKEGIRHFICEFNPLQIKEFPQNSPDRCYICKKEIFSQIIKLAKENGINNIVEGSNMDDIGDYRPGLKAIKELKVLSPLQAVGLTKAEIRILSKELGLNTWDKPSKACLASRFAYGEEITVEKLAMVEQAEQFLADLGYIQSRVRIHGKIARIETLKEQIDRFVQKHKEVVCKKFKELGFLYVVLDLEGYRTGSMNEVLNKK